MTAVRRLITAVLELSDVLWSDWGKPERVLNSLLRIGKQPLFPPSIQDNSSTQPTRSSTLSVTAHHNYVA